MASKHDVGASGPLGGLIMAWAKYVDRWDDHTSFKISDASGLEVPTISGAMLLFVVLQMDSSSRLL